MASFSTTDVEIESLILVKTDSLRPKTGSEDLLMRMVQQI
jgi:hypothetical protein